MHIIVILFHGLFDATMGYLYVTVCVICGVSDQVLPLWASVCHLWDIFRHFREVENVADMTYKLNWAEIINLKWPILPVCLLISI
jgi:hypothetical protein